MSALFTVPGLLNKRLKVWATTCAEDGCDATCRLGPGSKAGVLRLLDLYDGKAFCSTHTRPAPETSEVEG